MGRRSIRNPWRSTRPNSGICLGFVGKMSLYLAGIQLADPTKKDSNKKLALMAARVFMSEGYTSYCERKTHTIRSFFSPDLWALCYMAAQKRAKRRSSCFIDPQLGQMTPLEAPTCMLVHSVHATGHHPKPDRHISLLYQIAWVGDHLVESLPLFQ